MNSLRLCGGSAATTAVLVMKRTFMCRSIRAATVAEFSSDVPDGADGGHHRAPRTATSRAKPLTQPAGFHKVATSQLLLYGGWQGFSRTHRADRGNPPATRPGVGGAPPGRRARP